MSATIARQVGRVQLEQSVMHLALNMAKIAKMCFYTTQCNPCQNGTAKNLKTYWRPKETSAPPPNQHRQSTPEPKPPPPGIPRTQIINNSGTQHSQIINLLSGYMYSHPSVPSGDYVTVDVSAQDSQHNTYFDSHRVTDDAISTG
jgi:hypothetical protein